MIGKLGKVFNRIPDLLKNNLPGLVNFFSLGFLRATDSLVQLLLIPIIIQRVGINNFGIIAFVQVWLNYGKTFINYGLMVSGVREIALARDAPEKIARIFSKFFFTKAILAVIYVALLLSVVALIPIFSEKAVIFHWGIAILIGNLFFFDWFFIGLQRAQLIAVANLISKILFAVAVLILVQGVQDVPYVLAYQGIAEFLVGLILLLVLRRYYLRGPVNFPGLPTIRRSLREDFSLLYTNFILEFNSSFSIIMVNIFTNDILTGYFTVMHKLVQPLRFLLVIFSQTIFPVVCRKVMEGWSRASRFMRRSFLAFISLPLLGVGLCYYFASPLLEYFAGPAADSYADDFRLFLVVPLVILCNIPAVQLLLAYDQKKEYAVVHVISLFVKIVLDYSLIRAFQLRGAIASIVVVELFITLGLYFMLLKFRNRKLRHLE